MKHISPILEGILSNNGLKQGIVDQEILARWGEIVGELSRRTTPLRVQGGVLWIKVEHSALMQHLGFLAPRIIKQLKREVPETSVQRIRFTMRG